MARNTLLLFSTLLLLLPMGCRHKTSLPQRIFAGHTDYINSVAFSPDSKLLATASADHSVKLWEVATGREVRTLGGHTEVVEQVAFAPDGKILASAGWDHTVRLWNPENGTLLRTLTAHNLAVLSIAFSPDGKRLAGGSSDHTVTIWDVQTGKLIKTLQDTENPVAFSSHDNLLVTGNAAHLLKIWKVPQEDSKSAKWEAEQTLFGHTETIVSAAFSPDGKVIGSGSADTDALLWNVATWQQSDRLRLQLGVVRSITFTPDSRMFLAGAGRVVQFYDAQNGSNLKTLNTPFDIVTGIAISTDGKMLAVAGTFKSAVLSDNAGKQQEDMDAADRQQEKKAIVYTVADIFAQ